MFTDGIYIFTDVKHIDNVVKYKLYAAMEGIACTATHDVVQTGIN